MSTVQWLLLPRKTPIFLWPLHWDLLILPSFKFFKAFKPGDRASCSFSDHFPIIFHTSSRP